MPGTDDADDGGPVERCPYSRTDGLVADEWPTPPDYIGVRGVASDESGPFTFSKLGGDRRVDE